ncbi:MAG TPA: hypothetical protein VLT16_14110 [Candidatus Limnocylindrales bacterium]|nr:hypothetical protein [Candidatus Limnocylindrales bacterium]
MKLLLPRRVLTEAIYNQSREIFGDLTQEAHVPVFVLRLRDGNCVVVDADNEEQAREKARPLMASEVATTRKLESFVAQFSLTNEGDLAAVILEKKTIADLYQHEYPLLRAAHAQSYEDFGDSETDSATQSVLFDSAANLHARKWDKRDKDIIHYAVEQERLRFAH